MLFQFVPDLVDMRPMVAQLRLRRRSKLRTPRSAERRDSRTPRGSPHGRGTAGRSWRQRDRSGATVRRESALPPEFVPRPFRDARTIPADPPSDRRHHHRCRHWSPPPLLKGCRLLCCRRCAVLVTFFSLCSFSFCCTASCSYSTLVASFLHISRLS